jgi:arylsulfatase A-like enzyme
MDGHVSSAHAVTLSAAIWPTPTPSSVLRSHRGQRWDHPLNFLIITLDEFRGDSLSCAGHRVARTPALDALAAQGVRFARHFSQAAPCAPGRAALYTGTYQMNNRVVFNGSPLDDRFDNMARAARRAGYAPALFGYTDQAIDPRTVDPDDPRLFTYEGVLPGFDCIVDLTDQRLPWADWVRANGFEIPEDPDDALATEPERPAEFGVSAFLTNEFLDWHTQQNGAWFAHVSHLRPHPPFNAAGHWAEAFDPADVDLPIPTPEPAHALHELLLSFPFSAAPVDEAGVREMRAQYYGMIGDVDEQLGRIWQALRDADQWDDTVIIVTSDHGDQLGDHGLQQKMGWFEQSYHVPAIIRDPRHPAGHGSVVNAFTENVDLFPTLCDAMAIDIPRQVDGRPLTEFLDGGEPNDWRTHAHWEFDWRFFMPGANTSGWPDDRRGAHNQLTAQRSDTTGFVQFADGTSLLYDLVVDPTWSSPIEDPAMALKEAQQMLAWRAEHAERTLTDQFLYPRPS